MKRVGLAAPPRKFPACERTAPIMAPNPQETAPNPQEALRGSVEKGHFSIGEVGGSLAFRYLEYGIYVDLGVGNGYRRKMAMTCRFLARPIAWSIIWESPGNGDRGSTSRGTSA